MRAVDESMEGEYGVYILDTIQLKIKRPHSNPTFSSHTLGRPNQTRLAAALGAAGFEVRVAEEETRRVASSIPARP